MLKTVICVSAQTSILYVGYNSDAVVLQAIVTSIAPLFGAQFFLRGGNDATPLNEIFV